METGGPAKETLQATFGDVLRRHRTDFGISQEKLALECGLDRTYISLLERGLRTPTLHTVFVIATCLDVSPTIMVGEVEQALAAEH